MTYAEKVIAGENPLVPFTDTYQMHRDLDRAGIFRSTRTGRQARTLVQYRVDHGNGYHTQNKWTPGQHNPLVEDIKR